ncbi:NUDIX hydrolase [Bifidobacterium xylocopae]|uniref:DNA mismatch repair protein MutT n=1 Tax=Bifidobacterium xylocopae TaxID=2493119 RepID=A0A366KE16_9BIFI|nr:NUDIX domain-containing protein [Bifidobacterium xylocopae]RBP99438.1 DNA mismatch repair protein MutT [Bifidobacterium xylocopae]
MSATVEAAGAILYRWQGQGRGQVDEAPKPGTDPHDLLGQVRLCMVHRPKYDDWSWPKGKLEPHETHAHAAAREVGEETGRVIRMGPYLGEAEYPLSSEGGHRTSRGNGRRKHIVYWMAGLAGEERADRLKAVIGRVGSPDPDEVDEVAWVSVKKARKRLTHASDRQILDLFVERAKQGALTGATLIIVRHGKSVARKEWSGDDAQRPLTPRGAAAAYALNRELACWAPDTLFSSPWTRCLQTVRPYASETGQPIEEAACLTETAFADEPGLAYAWLDALMEDCLNRRSTTLVCMHRPVLGGVFDHLRGLCASKSVARLLAKRSPYMPTGTALALHFVQGREGPSIIDIQKAIPIVY